MGSLDADLIIAIALAVSMVLSVFVAYVISRTPRR